MSGELDEGAYKVLSKVKTLIERGGSVEALVSEYDDWAKEYNNDVAAIGYKVPQHVTKMLMESFRKAPTNECKILDVACGTGLVGAALRGLGFKGILHGIDGSDNMVAQARDTGHYDELIVQFIFPDSPVKTPHNSKYDAVTCVGAFTKNHFPAKVLTQLASLLKKDGTLVFSVRQSEDNVALCKEINEEICHLKESGMLEEICSSNTSHNVNWDANENSPSTEQSPSVLSVFCMRRL